MRPLMSLLPPLLPGGGSGTDLPHGGDPPAAFRMRSARLRGKGRRSLRTTADRNAAIASLRIGVFKTSRLVRRNPSDPDTTRALWREHGRWSGSAVRSTPAPASIRPAGTKVSSLKEPRAPEEGVIPCGH